MNDITLVDLEARCNINIKKKTLTNITNQLKFELIWKNNKADTNFMTRIKASTLNNKIKEIGLQKQQLTN